MRIFFTMNQARKYTQVLNVQQVDHKLLSFVYFQSDVTGDKIAPYVQDKKAEMPKPNVPSTKET